MLVLLIPAAATLHIVLSRRPAASAVAWVGLVWLAPVVGALVYAVLGVNRLHRRAVSLRRGVERVHPPESAEAGAQRLPEQLVRHRPHLEVLGRLGDRVSGRPLLAGNRVVALRNGDEAFPRMLEAIDGAERSVTLATYIFDNDAVGRRFRDALVTAAERGVEVRILVDDVGARYSVPPMVRVLRKSGLPTARFHRAVIPWLMPYFNLRNHRKILVADGKVGFTGGMNLRVGHWIGKHPRHPVRDLHFQVEGPVVREFQRTFAEDWGATTGEWLQGDRWFPDLEPRGEVVARGISDGPDVDYDKLPTMLRGALAVAKRRVRVVTPYFLPDTSLTDALTLAALRGVSVEIILPARSNLALVDWASRAHWEELLEKDCRIFLTPAPFDHSKLTVVDGSWVLFGTANWDPRSLKLNFEFSVECFDRRLAARLEALLRVRLRGAREVSLAEMRRRAFPYKLRDGFARLLSPYL